MLDLQKNENHVPGFCFENVSRNETFKEAKLKSVKTGTTIVGIIFKGGIILGADTRATNGPIVADKNCEKIHYISDYIYCCGAGTAADAEMTTELISSKMQLMQLTWKKKPYVSAACRQIRQELFKHMGYISAAFILGGVDNKGSHLYRISPHGSVCNMQFAAMGSGSLAALSVLESRYTPDMTEEEGKNLVNDAVCAGIFNDLGSGSNVDVCVIKQDVVDYIRPFNNANISKKMTGDYTFKKGTTEIISESVKILKIQKPLMSDN